MAGIQGDLRLRCCHLLLIGLLLSLPGQIHVLTEEGIGPAHLKALGVHATMGVSQQPFKPACNMAVQASRKISGQARAILDCLLETRS